MKFSLKGRLLVWGIASILGVTIGLSLYSSYILKDALITKAETHANEIASEISSDIELTLLRAKESTITMSQTLSQLRGPNAIKLSRVEMEEILKKQLKSNHSFFGTYVLFEPNAFDGKDNEFVNKPHHDKTGRFIPYFTNKGDGFNIESLVDYDKEGIGDYYLIPKKTRKTIITAPYEYPVDGKKVLMTSIVSPVVSGNEFLGIAGIDVSLDFFQQLVESRGKDAGTRIIIFDEQGSIAAFSGNATAILKNIFKDTFDHYKNFDDKRLVNNKLAEIDDLNMSVIHPILLEGKTWYVEVVQDKDVIMEPVKSALMKQVLIAVAIAFLFIFIGFIMLNKIAHNVSNIAKKLEESTESNRKATESVKDTSFQVASATNEQASAIEETASTLDEINAMVSRSVENAKVSTDKSEESLELARKGKETVEKMISSIDDISKSNDEIMEQIKESNEEIKSIINVIGEISDKTKVINDIVFQTKLLSFNASVEAARAGDNGKGFAVVAEEVGKLAEISGESAKDINQLLEKSNSNVQNIIAKTQSRIDHIASMSKQKINDGVSVANECGELLDEIVTGADKVKLMMIELLDASRQQSEGIKNISEAMGMLQTTTQNNNNSVNMMAANTEKLFKETIELTNNTEELKKEVLGQKSA